MTILGLLSLSKEESIL